MAIQSRWERGETTVRDDDDAINSSTYDLAEMQADMADLSGLLRLTNRRLTEVAYRSGGTRNREIVRILSLSRIACRIADAMVARFLLHHPQ